jgi:hypothetical protein
LPFQSPIPRRIPSYFNAEPAVSTDGSLRAQLSIDGKTRAPRATLIEAFTNQQLDEQAANRLALGGEESVSGVPQWGMKTSSRKRLSGRFSIAE